MRKHLLGVVVAIIVAFALAIGLGVATGKLDDPFSDKPEPGPKTETIVDEDGGTFTFPDGIVVIVPKGAVKEETTLSVGGITPLRAQDAGPFSDPASRGVRAGAVKFDVSLSRGDQRDIQPAKGKPLGITIPLRGKLKPMGVDARLALLYTPGVKGKGYQLVPTQPAKSGILRGTLQHLSPKYVTYVSDQGLLDSFFPERVKEGRGTCKQEVSVNDTKVKISRDNSQGWSLEDGSSIFACLSKGSDGYVRVGIANQLQFILSAAATDDVRLASSFGDPEEEVAKRLADLLFPNDKIKAYVGRDGKLVGSIGVDALPATVQLRGDPNTFLSEGAWQAIKLLTGILTGSSGNEIATTVLDAPAVITCVQSALRIGQGDLPSVAGVIDLVASKCTDQIVRALQPYVDPFNLLGRAQAIFSGLWDIVKTTRTAFDGIRMQFNGTISVKIVGDTPASLKPFVGDWHGSDGSHLSVKKDGSGSYVWREDCSSSAQRCHGNTTLRLTVVDGGITVSFGDVWYTDYVSGRRFVNTSPDYRSGDSLSFARVNEYRLSTQGGRSFCSANAPSVDLRACNIL